MFILIGILWTTYSLFLMNMVTYLVGQMHLSSSQSANIVTNFLGTLNILALLGGFLADAKLGRYLTVAIFASITALVRGFQTKYSSSSSYTRTYIV